MNTTQIIEKISKHQFKDIILKYRSKIHISPHALDHLSDAQRKVFKEEELRDILVKEDPIGVGLQRNGRYAAFYRRKWGYLRIILNITDSKLEIITFINTENIPNSDRLKNGK